MDESSYDQGYNDGYADGFEEARTMRRQDEYDNGYADGRRSMREHNAKLWAKVQRGEYDSCRCGLHPSDPPDEQRQHAASAVRQALRDGTWTGLTWDQREPTNDNSAEGAVAPPSGGGAGQPSNWHPDAPDSERDLGREPGHSDRHRADDALRHRDRPDASDAQRVGGQPTGRRVWTIPTVRPWQ